MILWLERNLVSMYKKIIDKLRDKNLAILGFGKEGKSTYSFIRKYLRDKHLTIIDMNDVSGNEMFVNDNNVDFICGDGYLSNLGIYDYIIKAPGISLKDIKDEKIKEKVTSQLELLLEVNRDNIIGVTGTKGKSTTSSLLYEVFKDQNYDVYLLGNIGVPVLDNIDLYKEDTLLIIEMSSHQLEFIEVSPHIGIVLNLFQDHLDHAGDLKHYHDNKMRMFKFQNENDIALYGDDNKYLRNRVLNDGYKSIFYDVRFDNSDGGERSVRINDKSIYLNKELLYVDGKRNLLGDHNLNNIMFIMTIAKLKGLDLEKAKESISKFKGLKYRMECIGTFNDVTYYNDTIATIPEATINAIKAIGNVDTLIFGGMDRHIEYGELIDFLEKSSISNLVCMPTTGFTIGNILKEKCNKNIFFVNKLEEAYKVSKENTAKGMSCLLSPAAASYEFFKNFEEKGKVFEEIVKGDK